MDEKKEKLAEAYRNALAADAIWSANLRTAFGKDAGDKRYTEEGRAVVGHDEFVTASAQWRRLVHLSQRGIVDPLLIMLCSLVLCLAIIVVGYWMDGTWTSLIGK